MIKMKVSAISKGYFQSINEFSLIKQVGVGSFGTVTMALHVSTNKFYALKIVDLNIDQNELLVLERQIHLHMRLDHPHIIKLWDTFCEGDTLYMVLELAENSSLFIYQNQQGALPLAQCFRFFQQAISAITYMHSFDIMHRDLKPQNILLDKNFNVKICDLGWATQKINYKRTTFCGTYEYMAPEMVDQTQYNYKIDIWALGILLYELAHGAAPYRAKSIQQMKRSLSMKTYNLAPHIPNDLQDLLKRMLQFQPQKRIQLAEISEHPWVKRMIQSVREQAIALQKQLNTNPKDKTSSQVQRSKHATAFAKKHRKNDSTLAVQYQDLLSSQLTETEFKKRLKHHKCKTQGSDSMRSPSMLKMFLGRSLNSPISPKQLTQLEGKQKQNILKNKKQSVKLKKLNQKLKQLSFKYGSQSKKGLLSKKVIPFC